MKRSKLDLLNKRVGAGFTSHDKDVIKLIKKCYGMSYAQLIRDAVHAHYSSFFRKES